VRVSASIVVLLMLLPSARASAEIIGELFVIATMTSTSVDQLQVVVSQKRCKIGDLSRRLSTAAKYGGGKSARTNNKLSSVLHMHNTKQHKKL